MMRYVFPFTIWLVLVGCNNVTESEHYKTEENLAIEDVTNLYLKAHKLPELLNPIELPDEPPQPKPLIDTLNAMVYMSDALLPIAQVKEDDKWIFELDKPNASDTIYKRLMESPIFSELGYREYNKKSIKFSKPFRQIFDPGSDVKEGQEYTEFQFSRICFNEELTQGILQLSYINGSSFGSGVGHLTLLLIEKRNGKWFVKDNTYFRH